LLIRQNPKLAFRDFEAAANAEYAQAWYRIGVLLISLTC